MADRNEPAEPADAAHYAQPVYCKAAGLLVKHWGGDAAVVYDPGRARTHLVNAEAMAVLTGIQVDADQHPAELLDALADVGLLLRR